MRSRISTIILFLIFIIGLSLLLYPTVADWWNTYHQSRAIASYSEVIANLDEDKYKEIWDAATEYNKSLLERPNNYLLSEEQQAKYNALLNVGETGVMGYIEIPSINIQLPIYHGTDESSLQVAVGHIEWSSLPVGGISSHCVLSGHRGLPSARLFTDLDRLVEGDIFMFRVLDEVLTYEVDQIRIVEPDDTQELMIKSGEDYCTLVTCTPYGVNSHRMLVRGHRIENTERSESIRITADALQIEPIIVAPIMAVPMLLVLLIVLMLPKRKKR